MDATSTVVLGDGRKAGESRSRINGRSHDDGFETTQRRQGESR